ncbi:hypothetical protein HDU97_002705 [Phlyctochytrium planicorne]|nr:hypothetical protein HDU97_002705 [Phlyctochytrium planicorne]
MIVDVRWNAFHSTPLQLITSQFPNLKYLLLTGPRPKDILCSISNAEISSLCAQEFLKLSHLTLDGFGHGGFSWSALKKLLQHIKGTLKVLSLSNVRDGIHLTEISTLVPTLKSLTILFSRKRTVPALMETPEEMPTIFSNSGLQPMLFGDLRGFVALETLVLAFHPFVPSDESRTLSQIGGGWNLMVTSLLQSLARAGLTLSDKSASMTNSAKTLTNLRIHVDETTEWAISDLSESVACFKNLRRLGWLSIGNCSAPDLSALLRLEKLKCLEIGEFARMDLKFLVNALEMDGGGEALRRFQEDVKVVEVL